MASSEPKTLQITLQQNKTSIQQGAAPSSIKFAQFLIFFSLSICIMRCLEDVELKSASSHAPSINTKIMSFTNNACNCTLETPKEKKRKHSSQHEGREIATHDKNSKSFERVI
jgi:hypothetical protein